MDAKGEDEKSEKRKMTGTVCSTEVMGRICMHRYMA